MRVFKLKQPDELVRNGLISNEKLISAAKELQQGLHNGNLGSGLYKKRVASHGRGKRGGCRMLVAYKGKENIFFLYGYPKNEQSNITEKEKEVYKLLAKHYLTCRDEIIEKLVENGEIIEVTYGS